jgi:hypothetical protein
VVDVLEDDGMAIGGDPAGEALAERDPNALLDLLFDPDRGAGNEIVARAIEQEDRAGVDLEQGFRPREQRVEQLLELQVAEGGVGQLLETAELMGVWAKAQED